MSDDKLLLNVGQLEPDQKVTSDELLLSLSEFIGFWKGGRLRVLTSKGYKDVRYERPLDDGLRALVKMLEHYDYRDNPAMKRIVDSFLRHDPQLPLGAWKVLLLLVKMSGTPHENDPIVVQAFNALDEISAKMGSTLSVPK